MNFSRPNSLTRVARVDANNVFDLTGAVLGMYVTAAKSLPPSIFRSKRNIGVFGWRCGSSAGNEELKLPENETVSKGVKDSDEMVTGRAKREVLAVKFWKALCRSEEAVDGYDQR